LVFWGENRRCEGEDRERKEEENETGGKARRKRGWKRRETKSSGECLDQTSTKKVPRNTYSVA
jgi:hypothetical protein